MRRTTRPSGPAPCACRWPEVARPRNAVSAPGRTPQVPHSAQRAQRHGVMPCTAAEARAAARRRRRQRSSRARAARTGASASRSGSPSAGGAACAGARSPAARPPAARSGGASCRAAPRKLAGRGRPRRRGLHASGHAAGGGGSALDPAVAAAAGAHRPTAHGSASIVARPTGIRRRLESRASSASQARLRARYAAAARCTAAAGSEREELLTSVPDVR